MYIYMFYMYNIVHIIYYISICIICKQRETTHSPIHSPSFTPLAPQRFIVFPLLLVEAFVFSQPHKPEPRLPIHRSCPPLRFCSNRLKRLLQAETTYLFSLVFMVFMSLLFT